jgi:glycosyltransferase involved in cell wall biosynthesis
MKVSIITSLYNAERDLEGLYRTITSQSLFVRDEAEWIIINARSTDNTRSILETWDHPNIQIDHTRHRVGLYEAWNIGIALARGDYITNANADDRAHPLRLEAYAHALDQHPDVAVVYGDHANATRPTDWGMDRIVPNGTHGYRAMQTWPQFDAHLLTRTCYLSPFPMWRRSLHQRYGGFDESYLVCGDYEFWLRVVAHGDRAMKVASVHPDGWGIYTVGGLSMTRLERTAYESARAVLQWGKRIKEGVK